MNMQYKAVILAVYWFAATVLTKGLSLEAAFISAGSIWLILALGDMAWNELGGTDTKPEHGPRDEFHND
jgi:hypothetical protein